MVERAALRLPGAGLTLAADRWGDPRHPPVVLLHGGGQTRHAWDGTAQTIALHGMSAITIDARGHGESDWAPSTAGNEYRLERFADDLVAACATFGAPPILVGASLGGYTGMFAVGALGLAARALVLVDIAPRIEPDGVARIMAFMTRHDDGFASLEEAADAVAAYLPHRSRPQNLGGLAKNLRLRDGRYHWHWDPAFVRGVQHNQPGKRLLEDEDIVRAIRIPTLLIRGRLSDLVSDEGVAHFRALVPHASYSDVSDAAHMVAGDQNDRFSDAVLRFIESL